MRLWSLHPQYLDAKGLVALWREALLAKNVLEGKTKGYKNHPQLNRFKACADSVGAINTYLSGICEEAERRTYHFNRSKIGHKEAIAIDLTNGQLNFERLHLLKKLEQRDRLKFNALLSAKAPQPHPMFRLTEGSIADWEK